MSRPRKRPVEEEISQDTAEVQQADPEPVVENTAPAVEETTVDVPEQTKGPDADEKARTMEWVVRHINEHSRRRPGAVSGMLPTVYRITISGGRVRYFTLPVNVEECAVEDSWKRCKPYMSSEEFMAFLARVLGMPPPPFYSVFRVINID